MFSKPEKKDLPLNSLFKGAKINKIKLHEGIIANSIADILMNLDKKYYDQAEEWLNEAITAITGVWAATMASPPTSISKKTTKLR